MTPSVAPQVAIRTGEADSRSVLKTLSHRELAFEGESVTKRALWALNSGYWDVCGRPGVYFLAFHTYSCPNTMLMMQSRGHVGVTDTPSALNSRVSLRSEDRSANRISSAFRLEKDFLFWVCEARHAALIVKGFNVGSADSEPHSNQMYEK